MSVTFFNPKSKEFFDILDPDSGLFLRNPNSPRENSNALKTNARVIVANIEGEIYKLVNKFKVEEESFNLSPLGVIVPKDNQSYYDSCYKFKAFDMELVPHAKALGEDRSIDRHKKRFNDTNEALLSALLAINSSTSPIGNEFEHNYVNRHLSFISSVTSNYTYTKKGSMCKVSFVNYYEDESKNLCCYTIKVSPYSNEASTFNSRISESNQRDSIPCIKKNGYYINIWVSLSSFVRNRNYNPMYSKHKYEGVIHDVVNHSLSLIGMELDEYYRVFVKCKSSRGESLNIYLNENISENLAATFISNYLNVYTTEEEIFSSCSITSETENTLNNYRQLSDEALESSTLARFRKFLLYSGRRVNVVNPNPPITSNLIKSVISRLNNLGYNLEEDLMEVAKIKHLHDTTEDLKEEHGVTEIPPDKLSFMEKRSRVGMELVKRLGID